MREFHRLLKITSKISKFAVIQDSQYTSLIQLLLKKFLTLMKYMLLIFTMAAFLLIPNSCSKKDICTCNVDHPEEKIPWLKNFLSNATYANVYKLELDGQEYIICTQVPGVDVVSLVFDCSGNLLCKSGANYLGENTCYYLSPLWDSLYQKRVLIYEKRQ